MSSCLNITAKKKGVDIDIVILSTTPTRWLREEISNLPYDEDRVLTIGEIRDWISTLERLQDGFKKTVADLQQELEDEKQLLIKAESEAAIADIRSRMDDLKASIQYYSDFSSDAAAFGEPWCCDRCLSALKTALSVMEENAYDQDVEFYIYAD